VRINSPGGTVTASEVVYREILRFKHETGVPVVAQLMGTATSGAYYAAMAADVVIAHPTTVTGSIGVLFLGINVAGLMEKVGIENQTLTAASTWFPLLTNASDYRVVASADWTLNIDHLNGIDFKLGVQDEYQSMVDPGIEHNDLKFYGALVFHF